MEEAAAQLLRGQDEGTVPLSLQTVVAACDALENGRCVAVLTMAPDVSRGFSENDVILLSKEDPQSEESSDEVRHALGIVCGHEGSQSLRVRFNLSEASQAGDEAGQRRVRLVSDLLSQRNSGWWALKLSNTSTIQREWAAAHCLEMSSLRDVILSARPAFSGVSALEAPPRMLEAMRASYNPAQVRAVTAGLGGSALTLIQGPPGTGKTKTILGLLSIILHSGPKGAFFLSGPGKSAGVREKDGTQSDAAAPSTTTSSDSLSLTPVQKHAIWRERNCPWLWGATDPRSRVTPVSRADPSDDYGLTRRTTPLRLGAARRPKARVLVCAPANSALDEIVLRLLTQGLLDAEGRSFTPSVVRVGVSIHHSVQSVSLDALAALRLGSASAARWELDRARAAVLEEASVVCTTLSFSGSAAFRRLARKFDVVVVDEAAQAVEPALLVPLAHGGAAQVYLVGDPVQLPATVLSSRALGQGYSRSLFSRLQAAGYPVCALDTQYRMHPAIRRFPSDAFYAGALRDGDEIAAATRRPWHALPAFGPLVFYDVPGGRERTPPGSNSLVNDAEAALALAIFRELTHRFPERRGAPSVAVISPYKAQVTLLRAAFKAALGAEAAKLVDINTIDGFQGRERDVAIFSTVRSSRRGAIGFVADERRINVGLTRSRASLFVLGNAAALRQDRNWGKLVVECASQVQDVVWWGI